MEVARKEWATEALKKIGEGFEGKDPQEVLKWAVGEFFPDIALACSFGSEDVALVDMIIKINPEAKIFYLDTNLLFKETYDVKEQLIERYRISPIEYLPTLTLEEQEQKHGAKLWERKPNECCKIRKIEPLERALKNFKAWITGIRRDQAPARANAGIVEWDNRFGLIKINPLASWTSRDVWSYITENKVPYNILHDRGYPSIGCEPCTHPVKPGEDPRAGRWADFQKTECGLHSEE